MPTDLSLVIINEQNCAEYCRVLFESLKKQEGLERLEIIFIDNASTDRVEDLASLYGVSKMIVLPSKTDSRSKLYNCGLEAASQEHILFVHSDSYFAPDFFKNYFSGDEQTRSGWVNFEQYYVDRTCFGKNQIGIDFRKKQLFNRQVFDYLPEALPVEEISEACFKIKRIPGVCFNTGYKNSFYEFELCEHLKREMPVNTIGDAKIYHYFLEMHEKITTLDKDRALWLKNNISSIYDKVQFMTKETNLLRKELAANHETFKSMECAILQRENIIRKKNDTLSSIARLRGWRYFEDYYRTRNELSFGKRYPAAIIPDLRDCTNDLQFKIKIYYSDLAGNFDETKIILSKSIAGNKFDLTFELPDGSYRYLRLNLMLEYSIELKITNLAVLTDDGRKVQNMQNRIHADGIQACNNTWRFYNTDPTIYIHFDLPAKCIRLAGEIMRNDPAGITKHVNDRIYQDPDNESRGAVFEENGQFLVKAVPASHRIKILFLLSGQWVWRLLLKIKRKLLVVSDETCVKRSRLFNAKWYLAMNPDVALANTEPLKHYLERGAFEGRKPGPGFDSEWYLRQYPDVAQAGINPLLHYIRRGKEEGRLPSLQKPDSPKNWLQNVVIKIMKALFKRLPLKYQTKMRLKETLWRLGESCKFINKNVKFADHGFLPQLEDPYVPVLKSNFPENPPVKLLAFYLPQFHEIPENNQWWGKGFTEWTNVRPARPLFKGHYQPRVPERLGYYNLTDTAVQRKQVEIAKLYGIGGFCFYFYWFGGKTLLEQPLRNYFNDKSLDFPFCLCWANENWTRRWDGKDKEILISQKHSDADDILFIQYVSEYLKDARYIRIHGKPLVLVYRPNLLPSAKKTAARWREWCRNNGVGDIYLAYTQSFEKVNPEKYGFDAAIEFPPNNTEAVIVTRGIEPVIKNFQATVYDYQLNVGKSENYSTPEYKLFRGVFPSWDNTARRKNESTVFVYNSPQLYQRWLNNAIQDTCRRFEDTEERLVFINAWNEWAEGAYLEPDQKYGYAWLQATRDALVESNRNYYNYTVAKNPDITLKKRYEMAYYFGADIHLDIFEWLADYTAFFRYINNSLRHVLLTVENEMPCVKMNDQTITIDSRGKIHDIFNMVFPNAQNEIIAFVLLQYNNVATTEACVNSILKLNDPRTRIVIVDNGSLEPDQKLTREKFAGLNGVVIINNHQNMGFAKGNNIGYKYAREVLRAKYILVINNDTVIEDRNFIRKMEKMFSEWAYSVLGPDIVITDGRHENPWNDYIYNLDDWESLLALYKKQQTNYLETGHAEFKRLNRPADHKHNIINPILQGAAYILSPIFISNNESLFEEVVFLYGEELLFSLKALLGGDFFLFSPELQIRHLEGVTTAQMTPKSKIAAGYDNVITIIECVIRSIQNELANELSVLDKQNLAALAHRPKKKILFDLFFCQPGYHGGGEYGKALFKAISQTIYFEKGNREEYELYAALNRNLFIDQWIYDICSQFGIGIIDVRHYDDIVALVNRDVFDLFYAPAIVVYTGYEYMKKVGEKLKFCQRQTKVIGSLLDIRDYEMALNFEKIVDHWQHINCYTSKLDHGNSITKKIKSKRTEADKLKTMYENIINSEFVDSLITISHYTKNDIIRRIGGPKEKIHVYYPPMKTRTAPVRKTLEINGAHYALLLNAERFEKNAPAVVRAFDELFESGHLKDMKDMAVVILGISKLDDLDMHVKHKNRFLTFGYMQPGELEYLYHNAAMLVYASLNEGFGYPPVEIMRYGKPSIVANNTALPEICEGNAIYCDPYDIESIKQAIREILACPIEPEMLKQHYQSISFRQKQDVKSLSEFILERAK